MFKIRQHFGKTMRQYAGRRKTARLLRQSRGLATTDELLMAKHFIWRLSPSDARTRTLLFVFRAWRDVFVVPALTLLLRPS